jgi:RimJ/RimL family protein N-acetyltransferase
MLVGDKVILRTWTPADLPALQILRNDVPLQRQLMAKVMGSTIEQVQEWLTRRSTSSDAAFYVVAEKNSNAPIGYVQLLGLDRQNTTGCLGICIDTRSQGHGYGAETLMLLTDYATKELHLKKINLQVLADNYNAIRLYKRHGFVETAYLKAHFDTGSGFADVVVMEKELVDSPSTKT